MAWIRLAERICARCSGSWYVRPALRLKEVSPGVFERDGFSDSVFCKETVCPECRSGIHGRGVIRVVYEDHRAWINSVINKAGGRISDVVMLAPNCISSIRVARSQVDKWRSGRARISRRSTLAKALADASGIPLPESVAGVK